MKNMKVRSKLIVSFLITVALALIIGIVGLYGILRLDDALADMYLNKAKPLGDLTTATEYFQRLRVQTRNAIIYTGNAEQLSSVESDMKQRIDQFNASMAHYDPSIVSPTARKLFDESMKLYNETFEPGILEVLDGAKAGKSQSALLDIMAETTVAANKIADNLAGITEARMGVMSAANDAGTVLGQTLLIAIIIVILLAATISITLAIYIANLISKPLATLTAFMDKAGSTGDISLTQADVDTINQYAKFKDETGRCIGSTANFIKHLTVIGKELEMVANGDLSVDVELLSQNDTMGVSLKKVSDGLNNMFSEINQSTMQVSTGSKQIADGAQALAQGSTQQAAAVEQLSSSIHDIADKTKTNADMAEKAAELASSIMGNAEKGSRQMDEMMAAVKEINLASQSINKVIKVIDDIAFQTNILALNAAVEAARAGQHGKGFAVVAEEVRNLAAKSAEAAKDTGSLIANSMEKAELGARIADETAASLVDIVSGITESNQLVTEIAKSSDEQSSGIEQINKGINQVAQVIQQNSATAEESAAASEEMSGQANMLEELISQFKLKDSGPSRLTSAPRKSLALPEKPAAFNDDDKYGSHW